MSSSDKAHFARGRRERLRAGAGLLQAARPPMKTCLHVLAAALALFCTLTARADLITWGAGLGNQFLTQEGPVLDGSYWFELGTFDTFTPTSTNVDDWAGNWHVFDRATTTGVGSIAQWDPAVPMLAGSANIKVDGTTEKEVDLVLSGGDPNYVPVTVGYDFRGKTAYLWAFNDRRTQVGAHWGLFTGVTLPVNPGDPTLPWAFPTTVALDCACTGFGADFNLMNITTDVLGKSTQGGNGPGTSTLILNVVPEPGSAVFLFATGMLLLIKRRRHFSNR